MPHPITPDPTSPAHDTLEAAVRALTGKFDRKSRNEVAGMIYKDDAGKFRYSITGPGSEDGFSLHVLVPKGYALAGIVHSHPGEDERGQVFSPNDLDVAHKLNLPSYVHFSKDGAVRKYVPGQTATQPFQDSVGSKIPLRSARGDSLDEPHDAPATNTADTTQLVAVTPSS